MGEDLAALYDQNATLCHERYVQARLAAGLSARKAAGNGAQQPGSGAQLPEIA